MPGREADAREGDRADQGRQLRSPKTELRRIEAARRERAEELRATIMVAALEASAERGYQNVRVRDVTDRYGGYRAQFYRLFGNVSECFDAAYEAEANALAERILERGAAQPSWRAGLRQALLELGRDAQERPAVTRALLLSAHIAGPRTRARRTEILERLTRAMDSARREPQSRHSPPPLTALFMVSAIEAAVVSALVREVPEEFLAVIPELEQLVFAAYFGD